MNGGTSHHRVDHLPLAQHLQENPVVLVELFPGGGGRGAGAAGLLHGQALGVEAGIEAGGGGGDHGHAEQGRVLGR